jgi:protein AroM
MAMHVLGTLTIGQAPRPDVVPVLERHLPPAVRMLHRGVLDGLSRDEIAERYGATPGEALLVTRLGDGAEVRLSRARVERGAAAGLAALEEEGADTILLLCTGSFSGLRCGRAWLIEPDRIIPPLVGALIGQRRLGIVVPVKEQIDSDSGKWRPLVESPLFAAASPYTDDADALREAGARLLARGADALLLDCIGFTERHRLALRPLAVPVILSNAVVARAVGELFAG